MKTGLYRDKKNHKRIKNAPWTIVNYTVLIYVYFCKNVLLNGVQGRTSHCPKYILIIILSQWWQMRRLLHRRQVSDLRNLFWSFTIGTVARWRRTAGLRLRWIISRDTLCTSCACWQKMQQNSSFHWNITLQIFLSKQKRTSFFSVLLRKGWNPQPFCSAAKYAVLYTRFLIWPVFSLITVIKCYHEMPAFVMLPYAERLLHRGCNFKLNMVLLKR